MTLRTLSGLVLALILRFSLDRELKFIVVPSVIGSNPGTSKFVSVFIREKFNILGSLSSGSEISIVVVVVVVEEVVVVLLAIVEVVVEVDVVVEVEVEVEVDDVCMENCIERVMPGRWVSLSYAVAFKV